MSEDSRAREAPAGVPPGRSVGRSALLSRHRQRAASGFRHGDGLRLRRHLYRELYAEVFEDENARDRFEAFAALRGPAFYRLPPNEGRITLRREPFEVPALIGEGDIGIVPFRAGETLRWRLAA